MTTLAAVSAPMVNLSDIQAALARVRKSIYVSPCTRSETFSELTAEFARKNGANYLLRGLRNTTDFEYENSIAQVNRTLNEELESVYKPLGRPIAIYGHLHRPFIRDLGELTVVNTGSVSLSYDGDYRAAYLLLDDSHPEIRRADYDLEKELKALTSSGLPHAEWTTRMLRSGKPELP